MQKTYLFYDIESSGLNRTFDQVLQFAAVRSDLNFNEIENHEILIKMNIDTIPNPKSTMVHHLGINFCSKGVNEFDGIQYIHKILNNPDTIILGYNILKFDDKLLQFSFYRNLLPPYIKGIKKSYKQIDLYPILIFYYLFNSTILKNWPKIDNRISLKLENINIKNNLFNGKSHNAITDVKTTIALAKKLKKDKYMWNYLIKFFDKQIDEYRCKNLPIFLSNYEGLMIMGDLGARNQYISHVLNIGFRKYYNNQSLWLRIDNPELRKSSLDNLDETTLVLTKKFSKPGFVLPPLFRYQKKIKENRLKDIKINKKWLLQNPNLFKEIIKYHQDYQYPTLLDADSGSTLYSKYNTLKFINNIYPNFHKMKWKDRIKMLKNFNQPEIYELAIRIIGRNFPNLLSNKDKDSFYKYLQNIYAENPTKFIIDHNNQKRMNLKIAKKELQNIFHKKLNKKEKSLLKEISIYLSDNQKFLQNM